MDEYGCFRAQDQDWDHLVLLLREKGNVTFAYSADGITAYILTIAGPLHSIGTLPWGGQVNGSYLVAMRLEGANYFDLKINRYISADYVAEKLQLDSGDAETIAELINQLRGRLT